MKPSVSFVICTEQGRLERMSMLLVESLREFGGAVRDAPVYSFAPRRGKDISRKTKRAFDRLGVRHTAEVMNEEFTDYPVANKAFASARAAELADSEILVFMDSDQLVLQEPAQLLLPAEFDVGVRPVHRGTGIGASGEDDPKFSYWARLYALLGVHRRDYVETTVSNERILSYWNSGLIAGRRSTGLYSRFRENLCDVLRRSLAPDKGRFFTEQTVFAATVLAMNLKVFQFSPDYNYPIPHHWSVPPERRINTLSDATTVHYHKIFTHWMWPEYVNPLISLLDDDPDHPVSVWLRTNLHRYGLHPPYRNDRIKHELAKLKLKIHKFGWRLGRMHRSDVKT